jgi:hypothetical protein
MIVSTVKPTEASIGLLAVLYRPAGQSLAALPESKGGDGDTSVGTWYESQY